MQLVLLHFYNLWGSLQVHATLGLVLTSPYLHEKYGDTEYTLPLTVDTCS